MERSHHFPGSIAPQIEITASVELLKSCVCCQSIVQRTNVQPTTMSMVRKSPTVADQQTVLRKRQRQGRYCATAEAASETPISWWSHQSPARRAECVDRIWTESTKDVGRTDKTNTLPRNVQHPVCHARESQRRSMEAAEEPNDWRQVECLLVSMVCDRCEAICKEEEADEARTKTEAAGNCVSNDCSSVWRCAHSQSGRQSVCAICDKYREYFGEKNMV